MAEKIVPGMKWTIPLENLKAMMDIDDNLRNAATLLNNPETPTFYGYALAKPGSFEWALIQMKEGKWVTLDGCCVERENWRVTIRDGLFWEAWDQFEKYQKERVLWIVGDFNATVVPSTIKPKIIENDPGVDPGVWVDLEEQG